jgi:hypothetical protein
MTSTNETNTAQKKLKVINLFGAPGMGKSSARSGVFWLMKSHHKSCEEISEYAKYLVLSGRKWQLTEEQTYLFSKQNHKQLIVERSGYEYAVTDSPLLLCSFYAPAGYHKSFEGLVDEASERFENINFFITRDVSGQEYFEERGREHNREQSLQVEAEMREYLAKKGVEYQELRVGDDLLLPWLVMEHLGFDNLLRPDFSRRGEHA